MNILRNAALPLTLRKKIGKLAGKPSAGTPFSIDLFGARYDGITGNHQDDKIYLYGAHEPATIRLLRSIAQDQRRRGLSPVYLDIGTNTGQHLTAVANAVDIACGFEPWQGARDRAETNLKNNNFTHAKVFPFGLSDETAELPYYPPGGNNLGVGSFAAPPDGHAPPVTLQLRHGEEFIKEHGLKPTLIKIDTEGYEAKVLKGLRECLAANRPAVVFEYGETTKKELPTLKDILALFPENYEIQGIRPSRETPALEPFRPGRRYENLLATPST